MVEITTVEVSMTRMGFALLLRNSASSRVVPIFIGPLETYSISSALEAKKPERPHTHDLMKNMLIAVGYRIEKVFIDEYNKGIFFAKIFLESLDKNQSASLLEIDSRSSDAVAMAIRFKAPIFMAEHVYKQTAIEESVLAETSQNTEEDFLTSLTESLPDDVVSDQEKKQLVDSISEEFGNNLEKANRPRTARTPEQTISQEQYLSKADVLARMLSKAIHREDYEEAALLRDELAQLQTQGSRSKLPEQGPSQQAES